MTDNVSIKNIPQINGRSNSFLTIIAITDIIPPIVKLPVSPIKIWAGKALYHKNPIRPPIKAEIKITISLTRGMYIIFKYSENIIFPETHAKIANVRVIITDEPAAKPSIPSDKFAPLETEVIIKITKKINAIKLKV